jgi:hypothetical protein
MPKTQTKKKEPLKDALVPVAVKLPGSLHDRICEVAPFMRGGKSEVIRRSIVSGLPIVIQQRGVRIPAKGGDK